VEMVITEDPPTPGQQRTPLGDEDVQLDELLDQAQQQVATGAGAPAAATTNAPGQAGAATPTPAAVPAPVPAPPPVQEPIPPSQQGLLRQQSHLAAAMLRSQDFNLARQEAALAEARAQLAWQQVWRRQAVHSHCVY
jgi:hypothetical protein